MKMDSNTQLLIRACKRPNSINILNRIYTKRYLNSTDNIKQLHIALAHILSGIVDQYCPMSVSKVIVALNQTDYRDNTYEGRAFYMLRDQIAHASAESFPGLIPPAWVRNKF